MSFFSGLREKILIGPESYWGAIECILITGIFTGAGFLFFILDPVYIYSKFTWIWLAPIIVGLRYGTGLASLSCLIIIVVLSAIHPLQLYATDYGYYALGGVLVSLVCGQFRSIWAERIERAESIALYSRERMENISRMYYMTRISHDRLEQNLINKPVTLRSALADIRRILDETDGRLNEDIAKRFLNLLVQYCSITVAGLFPMKGEKMMHHPMAHTGEIFHLNEKDPLVIKTLENESVNYLAVNGLDKARPSEYLVAAPLRSSQEFMGGLILIKDMPFMAMNEDNLHALTVLCSYFSDDIWSTYDAKAVQQAFPACDPKFAAELCRLQTLKVNVNVDSALTAVAVKRERRYENLIVGIRRQARGLDYTWKTRITHYDVLLTLMPLANPTGAEGYIMRIKEWLKSERGMQNTEGIVKFRYIQMHAGEPDDLIKQLLEQLDENNVA